MYPEFVGYAAISAQLAHREAHKMDELLTSARDYTDLVIQELETNGSLSQQARHSFGQAIKNIQTYYGWHNSSRANLFRLLAYAPSVHIPHDVSGFLNDLREQRSLLDRELNEGETSNIALLPSNPRSQPEAAQTSQRSLKVSDSDPQAPVPEVPAREATEPTHQNPGSGLEVTQAEVSTPNPGQSAGKSRRTRGIEVTQLMATEFERARVVLTDTLPDVCEKLGRAGAKMDMKTLNKCRTPGSRIDYLTSKKLESYVNEGKRIAPQRFRYLSVRAEG
jgi:hypothetical protein